MPSTYAEDLARILPETVLALGACAALVADLLWRGRETRRVGWIALASIAASLLALLRQDPAPAIAFGMVTVDGFGALFKVFVAATLAVVVLFAASAREMPRHGAGEFYFLLLSAGVGAFFLVSTTNLLLLVLSLETLGLASYVLAGFAKGDRRSAEAALKYLVFGAAATGVMLFGLSILFGLTGTLEAREMAGILAGKAADPATGIALDRFRAAGPAVAIAVVLALVGFGYKVSAVPFHWWAPDVYEGAPTPVTTFLAVASKGAAFGALLRFGAALLPPGGGEGATAFSGKLGHLLALLSALTMTFGNLAAVRQNNLKRLLAYSSIAHAGYTLMGVAAMNPAGFEASVFYLFAYYFMNLGAFGAVIYYARSTGNEDIGSLRGLGWRAPFVSVCVVVFLISLVGIPPSIGFFGKYYLFMAAWDSGLGWLTVVAAANAVVSLFYYFRIAKALYLVPESEAVAYHRPVPALAALLGLLTVGTVGLGLFPKSILAACAESVRLIF
ncbi:MAG TPA: NADH-quinone oxidoreductase subunit N [Planctomycetota bacterium]|jgi:NADH-quinone oxidoreductase subunit N|nr:NADH-quinone oxidoreductase subunit N [Planctomycetota bacterium]